MSRFFDLVDERGWLTSLPADADLVHLDGDARRKRDRSSSEEDPPNPLRKRVRSHGLVRDIVEGL